MLKKKWRRWRDRSVSVIGLRRRLPALSAVALLGISACVVNPVTGQREVGFISVDQQIRMGEQHYLPAQQMQGGRYGVDPGVTEYVREVGMRLAAVSDVDLPYEFVVLNNPVPNAWAMPGGKLAINRGLLTELNNEAELAAVLGHEIVHAAGRHGAKALERQVLTQAALLGVVIGAQGAEYGQAMVGGAALAAGLLNQRYGRDAEREADHYGTRYLALAGYDPMAAVTLQETFVRLAEGRTSSWLEGLFASHPPSAERVANNRRLAEQLRAAGFTDGTLGEARFAEAMAPLRRDADAYTAAEEARKALAARDYDGAHSAIQRALALQDREPSFHGLLGDIERRRQRYAVAIAAYDRAIERDAEFYAYYLGRGLAHNGHGQRHLARADFDRSLQLLPTAVAYNELGRFAEADGDIEQALKLFRAAEQSDSPAGRAARERIVRLELPRQPSQYLDAQVERDARGRLLLAVSNRASVPVIDVQVRIETVDDQGRRREGSRRLRQIEPGATVRAVVMDDATRLVDARAGVVAARVGEPAQ
jgi:predicted Zn-dependent protease